MGVVLVVLPDTEFRRGLQRELDKVGFEVLAVPDWPTAIEARSVLAVEAVLFDPEQSPAGDATWRAGLEQLRAVHPGLVPVPLGGNQPNPTQPNPTQI